MGIYGELDPMPEQSMPFVFKGKREDKTEVNMQNLAYPNQYTDIETICNWDNVWYIEVM